MAEQKNAHEGHRARMRDRFINDQQLDGFAEHEIMEMLLYFIFKRRDTNAIAHDLVEQFGSVREVINAPIERLKQIKSIGENGAVMIRLFGAIADHANKQQFDNVDARDLKKFAEYVRSLFTREQTECFKVLCITAEMKVKAVAVVSRGNTTSTPVNMRQLAKTVLNCGTDSIILAHNHPGSSAMPSNQDIIMTRKIIRQLSPLGIDVLDHYVTGVDGTISMRSCGMIHDIDR